MKLAIVNPRLDFNIDNLYAKEVFPSCTTNFPAVGNMPSKPTNHPPYLYFNPIQQVTHHSSSHPVSLECNKFNPLQHGMLNCIVFRMWSHFTGSLTGAATDNGNSNDRWSEV
ncbi:hypothetical protein V6N12_042281 [Hibiscus sabdariffa]|uniref:Uncharacterized protein n=1 Tax=Hibiscus sabdariffa TaxID=183260 RepID=A0ABR2EEB9_9ROSI